MPEDSLPIGPEIPLNWFFGEAFDMLCLLDRDGAVLRATRAWEAVLGWSEADLRAGGLTPLLHPEDRDHALDRLRVAGETSGATHFTCRLRHRDGLHRWLGWRILGPARDGLIPATVQDITDARRASSHAAEVEQISGTGFWEIDLETGRLFWSPRTRAIHEVADDFFPTLEAGVAFYLPEAHPPLRSALRALIDKGQPFDLELPFVTARGRHVWVRATATAEMRGGHAVRVYGTFREVTAERDRRMMHERFEAVARLTSSLVMIADADFRLAWVNPAFERLTGFGSDEALGKRFPDLVSADGFDIEGHRTAQARLVAGESVRREFEYRGKHGNVFTLDHDLIPFIGKDGKPTGFVSVSADVTARKATEARLVAAEADSRAARNQLEAALAATDDALYITDENGILVTAHNPPGSILPDVQDMIRLGESYSRLILDVAAASGFDAVEKGWLQRRMELHQGEGGVIEAWLRDGRCIRLLDRPIPGGGRVISRVDITETKQRERMLRDIIAATGAVTWELDIARDTWQIDPEWIAHLGYAPGELDVEQSRLFDLLVHPEDAARARAIFDRRLEGDESAVELDMRIRRAAGDYIWVQDRGRVIRRAADGTPLRAAGTFQDITARKLAESRLLIAEAEARDARAELIEAIDALDDGFVLFDSEDRLRLFNRRNAELFALNRDSFRIGNRYEDMLRAGVAKGLFPDARGREDDWIAGFAGSRSAHHEVRLNDGRWIRWIDRATARGGRIGLRIDITELRGSRRRLEEILDGTRAATWEADVLTGEMIFNDRWCEMIGYRRDEVRPHVEAFVALLHPEDGPVFVEARARHLRGEIDYLDLALRVRHREGHWVWILDRGRISRWTEDGRPERLSGTHIDITAQKQAEAELVAAREAAEQANQAKSQFLATMSHEIRTPLNGVLGIATMLAERATDPDEKRLLGIMRESGETLLDVINDVLDMSKIEAGRLELEAVPFVPAELAREVEALHRPRAQAKGLRLTIATTRDVAAARIGDPHKILQILHNLVGNAIKFTSGGSVSVTFDGDPRLPLTIEVRDTGIGMSEEHQARLFEKFSQADSSTTRKYGGSGLGMSIVEALTRRMGGEVSVQSRLGHGTLVRVTLPLVAISGSVPAVSSPVPETSAVLTDLRVLVAEDNAVNRLILSAMLGKFGAFVTMTESGADAVAAFEAGAFDLLLFDICMPGLDGIETLAAVRARERAAGRLPIPAIAVTANAMRDQIEGYLAAGFTDHVSKPIDVTRFRSVIERSVARVRTA